MVENASEGAIDVVGESILATDMDPETEPVTDDIDGKLCRVSRSLARVWMGGSLSRRSLMLGADVKEPPLPSRESPPRYGRTFTSDVGRL